MKWQKFPTVFCIKKFLEMNIGDHQRKLQPWNGVLMIQIERQGNLPLRGGGGMTNAVTNFAIVNFFYKFFIHILSHEY